MIWSHMCSLKLLHAQFDRPLAANSQSDNVWSRLVFLMLVPSSRRHQPWKNIDLAHCVCALWQQILHRSRETCPHRIDMPAVLRMSDSCFPLRCCPHHMGANFLSQPFSATLSHWIIRFFFVFAWKPTILQHFYLSLTSSPNANTSAHAWRLGGLRGRCKHLKLQGVTRGDRNLLNAHCRNLRINVWLNG